MKKDMDLFKGKNIITYNTSQFTRDEALEHFIIIKTEFLQQIKENDSLRIDIDRKHISNLSVMKRGHKFTGGRSFEFKLNGTQKSITRGDFYLTAHFNFNSKIKYIRLTTPFLRSDKRWDSIGLTSSQLFLGSALTGHSYNVTVENLALPLINKQVLPPKTDLWGFTLFEDIFPAFRKFLIDSPPDPGMLTAAGGPFVTLSPYGAIFHLPEINLFIRGEAELIFPEIIDAISSDDLKKMLTYSGFYYQREGFIIISDYNEINSVEDLGNLNFHFSFTGEKELAEGLEMNFSRGCRNSCIFCSKIQGRKFRKLPPGNIERLLLRFRERVDELKLNHKMSSIININDDDILQDPEYADSVFSTLLINGFSIWGIQSSISSFFIDMKHIKADVIKLISEKNLYKDNTPLLWIGTDTFLKNRSSRMGKPLPDISLLYALLNEFEKNEINNYHYWISSDHMSSWKEFLDELIVIQDIMSTFPRFSVLPHSPFLIPYPSTPAYKLITGTEGSGTLIKYRDIMKGVDPVFDLILVDRVMTGSEYLNRLLLNEKRNGKKGFLDYLKNGDINNALICAYDFLKDDRISGETFRDKPSQAGLMETENKFADFITKIV